MDEIRRKRVEEELRDSIAALIIGGEVKDPRVGPFVSVTRVEAARDLSAAKVYVSTFAASEDGAAKLPPEPPEPASGVEGHGSGALQPHVSDPTLDMAVEGLQHAAGFIQSQLGKRLRTRLTPRLHFIADRGIKDGFELGERIKGLFS